MPPLITTTTLAAWLKGTEEIAFFDVREHGQYCAAHPFFAVSLPYSRLEIDVRRLAPRTGVRIVLIDNGDSLALLAARRLTAIGYRNVYVVEGGIGAWKSSGHKLFKGSHLPSLAFAEVVERACRTPSLTAAKLHKLMQSKSKLLILDTRSLAEHQQATIPGSTACPEGQLPYCCRDLIDDADTTIVVHGGTRARSVIGAQTLLSLGVENPVFALRDGIEGWLLQGHALQHASVRRYTAQPDPECVALAKADAARLAGKLGVPILDGPAAQQWIDESSRTTYVFDVRAQGASPLVRYADRVAADHLLHATCLHVGVRQARLLLLDEDEPHALVAAAWLRQMGLDAAVLRKGAAAHLNVRARDNILPIGCAIDMLDSDRLRKHARSGPAPLVDLRSSTDYRRGHAAGAIWSIRPLIIDAVKHLPKNSVTITLIADDPRIAQLAALDLKDAGFKRVHMAAEGLKTWRQAELAIHACKAYPSDATAIDCVSSMPSSTDCPVQAGRSKKEREEGLTARCGPDELGAFRLTPQLNAGAAHIAVPAEA